MPLPLPVSTVGIGGGTAAEAALETLLACATAGTNGKVLLKRSVSPRPPRKLERPTHAWMGANGTSSPNGSWRACWPGGRVYSYVAPIFWSGKKRMSNEQKGRTTWTLTGGILPRWYGATCASAGGLKVLWGFAFALTIRVA